MKKLLLAFTLAVLLGGASLRAQGLTFIIHDSTGQTADTPLPSTYIFPDTTVGATSDLIVRAYNNTGNTIEAAEIFFGTTPDFTVTGTYAGKVLAPNGTNFEEFTVHFKPSVVGSTSATLQVGYMVQQNGCDLTSSTPATECPATIANVTGFQGNVLAPALVVSYTANGTSTVLRSTDTINFGNVSLSATSVFAITLQNTSSAAITTPPVSVQNQVYASSAFTSTATSLPATIGPNSSVSFNVTFAPGQTGLTSATLLIGTNSYPLSGDGIVLADIDALQFSCVDQTGVRTLPQAATPISFGQVTAGANATAGLTCTVANPSTSFNPVSLSSVVVTGAAYSLSGLPSMPASIAPGASISFQLIFAAVQTGISTGTLSIGTRQFQLTGVGANLPMPNASLVFDAKVFTSQMQPHVTVQLASNSTIDAVGTLTMQFTPTVANISDDPAILFLATSGRSLQINIQSGTQTGTYSGQSALTFQTGSTAGTITFTLTFPNKQPITQSIDILPTPVVLTASTAVRQSPNLVVTVNGYDNTYSTGQLTFKFYDANGVAINPNVTVDASTNFHNYFFVGNTAGGVFSLQASFPVSGAGSLSQIGAVDLTMNNSSGASTTTHLIFQ